MEKKRWEGTMEGDLWKKHVTLSKLGLGQENNDAVIEIIMEMRLQLHKCYS